MKKRGKYKVLRKLSCGKCGNAYYLTTKDRKNFIGWCYKCHKYRLHINY